MTDLARLLTVCSCCDGVELETPTQRWNRPGLSALDYRAGTHGRFKASMEAGISIREALSALTTRSSDDWTVALLDAWAVVLDVLTFYQERAANEGFLRTATERRSLLELARLVGYEPRPGVAASTHLAFRVSGSTLPDTGGPARPRAVVLPPWIEIPAGTRAQSSPGPGELPQPFETSDDLEAREEWNELRPRLTHPQTFDASTRIFYFRGTATGLEPGDRALLVISNTTQVPLQVIRVEPEDPQDRTRVVFQTEPDEVVPPPAGYTLTTGIQGTWLGVGQKLTADAVSSLVDGVQWSQAKLSALASMQHWHVDDLSEHARFKGKKKKKTKTTPIEKGVFALRARSGVFGHNAPRYDSTPTDWRVESFFHDASPPFPDSWEDEARAKITVDSQGTAHDEGVVFLERTFPEILSDSWVVLQAKGKTPQSYRVEATGEESVADFGLSAKVTRLKLDAPQTELDKLRRRETSVFAHSELLELVELPIEDDVEGNVLELALADYRLEPGRLLSVTGERSDLDGVIASEIVAIQNVDHVDGRTRLTFESDLEHTYRRDTVTLNANVVAATHGETHREVLGDGDAATPFQRFRLRHKPLTHVSAANPSGAESTLELRVRGVLRHEASSFFPLGPKDRRYVLRRDDDGTTRVLFGDGVRGERLPTGSGNVTATYRTGLGLAGHVDAGRISMLATRPLGVDEVINPVPARGGEDAESRDRMRDTAPLTVRTLDRIVSLEDFADFARAFSGIGKAHAARVWDGERWVIHVTLASADGEAVDDTLQSILREAMDAAREPHAPLVLGSLRRRFFEVRARLQVHPDHVRETVVAAADAALREAFSFEARDLGQRVAQSDVVTLLQEIPGVVAVDLDRFQRLDTAGAPALARHLDALPAGLVGSGGATQLVGTEILLLAPGPVPLVAVEALDAPDEDEEEEIS